MVEFFQYVVYCTFYSHKMSIWWNGDTLVLEANVERRKGSNPFMDTNIVL